MHRHGPGSLLHSTHVEQKYLLSHVMPGLVQTFQSWGETLSQSLLGRTRLFLSFEKLLCPQNLHSLEVLERTSDHLCSSFIVYVFEARSEVSSD